MALTADEKTQIINEYATHEGDTGSPEVQVALLSKRIADLTRAPQGAQARPPLSSWYAADDR